ncbi:hypothetical protein ACFWY9_08565 [Amycolatopsis sp. NPDC059027]|uniref:hypothetical protein n=1 Tax=unclassified Amycolatopsis TaxID=2618356 RepID=UPI003671A0AA
MSENDAGPALPAPGTPEVPEPDYTEAGVPGFDYVRDRIEKRYTTAIGSTELAGIGGEETAETLDKKIADRDEAAKDKLAEIRRQLRGE